MWCRPIYEGDCVSHRSPTTVITVTAVTLFLLFSMCQVCCGHATLSCSDSKWCHTCKTRSVIRFVNTKKVQFIEMYREVKNVYDESQLMSHHWGNGQGKWPAVEANNNRHWFVVSGQKMHCGMCPESWLALCLTVSSHWKTTKLVAYCLVIATCYWNVIVSSHNCVGTWHAVPLPC